MIAAAKIKPEWIFYGLAIGAALIFLPGALRRIGGAPGEVIGGALDSAGSLFMENTPLPNTRTPENIERCKAALAAGNDLEASFYCPAGTWIGGLFDGEWF